MKQVLEIARFTVKGRFTRPATILVAIGLVAALGVWYYVTWLPPIPQRPLRIGFEPNPPVQIRTGNGFTGLAVETVNEAARRAAAMGGNWNEFRRIL